MSNKHKTFKNRTQVYTNQDKFFIIDNEDWEKIKDFTWTYSDSGNGRFYIVRNIHAGKKTDAGKWINKKIYLHRFLMDAEPGQIVDHIDNNPLNNRRSNFRFATKSQNAKNRKLSSKNKKSDSNIPGVYWHKKGRCYCITIRIDKKPKYMGCFKNKEDAESAIIKLKNEHYGEFSPYWGKNGNKQG